MNKINDLKYEIEFLRAISVLLVLLFHFEFFIFKGGFIGVDVFFVISGYLITNIILKKKNNFDIKEFYIRRFKRLFPIILLITILTIITGIFILSPIHFERLTSSSKSTIFGLSNFFFFREQGYFDHQKLFKPLLHTWSLSVEIQFYIIWPIIIIFFKKYFNENILTLIVSIFLISLILSTLYSFRTSSFFYFTGFRFYEFMVGALIVFFKKKISKNLSNLFFLIGILIIIYSSIFFDESFSFPDYYALIPCIGAALIIISGNSNNNFNFITENKYIILLGRISYTVYMTHWPVLIFYRYQKIDNLLGYEKIILIIFVLVISYLLFKYFEEPLRKKDYKKNIYLILLSLFTFVLIFVSNLYIKSDQNYLSNKFYNENKIINEVFEGRKIKNTIENDIINRNKKLLYFNNDNKNQKILIVGDSHAYDFYLALKNIEEYKTNYQFEYIVFDYLYCFKTKSIKDEIIEYFNYKIIKRKNSCQIVLNNFDKKILKIVDKIILSNRWDPNTDFELMIKYFMNYNKNLIIVGNGQTFYDIPTLFYKKTKKINSSLKNLNKNLLYQNNLIKKESTQNKIKFFNRSKLNCNPECVAFKDDILLYSDKDHWSFYGLKFFSNKIYQNQFDGLLK